MKRIIGLDIGGTKCAVVLAQVGRKIDLIDRLAFPTETWRGPAYAQGKLFDSVRDILANNGLTPACVDTIGVSCGGPLNSKKGIILCPPNLTGWVNVPFVQMLEDAFHIPAFLQNDAKACALVEWKMGAGRGAHHMLFLTMGTGMGCGIIAEDRLICGACDMGGEVGHIRIEADGPIGFGKAGAFSGFTSGGGIGRLARAMARKALERRAPYAFAQNEKAIAGLDARMLADFAHQGDADARRIFAIVGEKLGKGIAILVDTLNPELVVIGSIFVRCEDLLRPAMEAALDRECIPFSRQACRIVPAQTGERIGDLASIMVALYGEGMLSEIETLPSDEGGG